MNQQNSESVLTLAEAYLWRFLDLTPKSRPVAPRVSTAGQRKPVMQRCAPTLTFGHALSFSLLLATPVMLSSAEGATLTWSGASGALWNNSANWGGAGVPANGYDLVFNTGSANTATNDFANNSLTLNSITFSGTTQTLGQAGTNGISIGAGGVTANANTATSALVLPVTLSANQTWSVGTNSTLTVNRAFAMGANTLTKTGAGTLRLTNNAGSSSAGSQILVQNGTLEALYQNDLKSTTALVMGGSSNATTLKITDGNNANRLTNLVSPISIAAGTTGAVTINNTVAASVTPVTLSGTISLGTTTDADLVFNTTTGSVTKVTGLINGSMTGTNSRGNFTFSGGNGEVQFNNANNSFTGVRGFGIQQGVVVLGVDDPANGSGNGALGKNTATVFVGTSATPVSGTAALLLDGANYTNRAITVGNAGNGNAATYQLGSRTTGTSSFGGNITLNRDVQLTAATSGTVTFSGVFNDGANTQSVTKIGNGTVVLSGSNTYDGATNVNAGKLVVNGTHSGSGTVTVASGATLGGNGTLGGATIVSGTHAPGNSPGLQTFANGLSYENGSTFQFELVTNGTSGRGTNYDAVNVTGGALVTKAGVTSALVFNSQGSVVDWSAAFWGANQSWLVFDNANTPDLATGIFSTITLSNDVQGDALATVRNGASFAWANNGNDVYLTYTVPEPAGLLLVGLTSVLLLRRRDLPSRRFLAGR